MGVSWRTGRAAVDRPSARYPARSRLDRTIHGRHRRAGGLDPVKLGLHLANFTYGVPVEQRGATIGRIVTGADAAGFDRLSVMDHYFQIPVIGPVDHAMFEAYNLLGYIAAKTARLKLGVLATGVTYRQPG